MNVLAVLSGLRGAAGRFETHMSSKDKVLGIIDYAHTPDALQNVLSTIHDVMAGQGRVITIVGCGGDRDAAKRPVMARIACELSDQVILTSDNPRSEDPEAILDQIAAGIAPDAPAAAAVVRISDRATAIRTALSGAHAGDVLLVAGKGHEDYQIIGTQKTYFDDGEVVRNWAAAQSAAQLQQPQELAS